MDKLSQAYELGNSLGYQGEELEEWVETRMSAELERVRLDKETEKVKMEAELEKARMELERSRIELEMAKLRATSNLTTPSEDRPQHTLQHNSLLKNMPKFDDAHDNLDSYIRRFETIAKTANVPEDTWGTYLLTLIGGKGLDACQSLTDDEMKTYRRLRDALLEYYNHTEDTYRSKYHGLVPKNNEDFKVFTNDLKVTLDKWIDSADIVKSYDGLLQFILIDKVLTAVHPDLYAYLQERKPKDLKTVTELTQKYMAAHPGKQVNKEELTHNIFMAQAAHDRSGSRGPFRAQDTGRGKWSDRRPPSSSRQNIRCFNCNQLGHYQSECTTRTGRNENTNNYNRRNRDGHNGKSTSNKDNRNQTVDTACIAALANTKLKLPTFPSLVGSHTVNAIRDTGATIMAVRKTFVKPEQYTGRKKLIEVFGGKRYSWPTAKVDIDSPYISGRLTAVVFEKGPYDLIIGNIGGVKSPSEDEVDDWVSRAEINMMETRAGKKEREEKEKGNLISDTNPADGEVNSSTNNSNQESDKQAVDRPNTNAQETTQGGVTVDETIWNAGRFQAEQKADPTLAKILRLAQKGSVTTSQASEHSFFVKNNTVVRKYKDKNQEITQLVTPQRYRTQILRQAHDLSLAGHMGRKKTKLRIQAGFYWPGMDKDITNYVQSCSVCRCKDKTAPRPAPLQQTDLADKPFEKLAIDIVGPISPSSARGHRFILTVVDLATRWPEAFPLKTTTSEDIIGALMTMFARTGFPDTILSDRGPQFTSELSRQIAGILGIKQAFTTPYHPQSNGICERLNGTLKSMLTKITNERPENWDMMLPCVLFAYREIPHSSTGFSPFELVYGANPRGPMEIIKTLLFKENVDQETRSVYERVVNLREDIMKACQVAKLALDKCGEMSRTRANVNRKLRTFQVGDQVRVLLPSKQNKLQLAWQGPFTVTEKISNVDYEIDFKGKRKIFHINILSAFGIRPADLDITGTPEIIHCALIHEEDEEDTLCDMYTPTRGNEDWRDVKIGEAPHVIKQQIKTTLESFKDTLSPTPGKTSTIVHDIQLTSSEPIKLQQYNIPLHYRDDLHKEITELLEEGIIERSESPYAAPIVLAKKKNGEIRLCIDYRHLNKITIADAEPMPIFEDLLVRLTHAKYFTKLDLSRGYWQIPIREEAKPYTAFITPFGLFQWNYMSFGLMNAPATFNRLMRKVLAGRDDVISYLDDICMFHATWEEHIAGLRSLLALLKQHGLTARPSKVEVGMTEIQFLGHMISQGQMKPVQDTVQRILDIQVPKTKKTFAVL